ncbi:MAG: ABC transporter ATP-binding protein [Ruminococcaceae bacterium]|nr:ABC transporter ATP-binding protein [Oscillospiraceae bacterium]
MSTYTNALEIKKLTKSFKEFKLDDINLTLPGGCIMGLIGENGAGKSTLIRLILDMLHKDSGTVTVLGKDNGDNLKLTKEEIGVVTDEIGIPECLNAKQVGKIMKHTFKSWDEKNYKNYLVKLAIPDNKQFKDFSRGMKMKLGIAVALSHDSKLLLLDEATSGLDPVVRDEVVEMFGDFTRDETHSILLSSHIVSDLEKICDYIAFLHKGKLLLCEEKDRLLEEYGIVRCECERLKELDPKSILNKKVTPYGAEAVVLRNAVPQGVSISPISIEELFVHMVKEERSNG